MSKTGSQDPVSWSPARDQIEGYLDRGVASSALDTLARVLDGTTPLDDQEWAEGLRIISRIPELEAAHSAAELSAAATTAPSALSKLGTVLIDIGHRCWP